MVTYAQIRHYLWMEFEYEPQSHEEEEIHREIKVTGRKMAFVIDLWMEKHKRISRREWV